MSSGFSYPQPIFTSPIYNPAFYLTLDASGYLTYEYAQTLYLDKNDYRLTYITGITPGTATQGIALVPGTNNDISGIGALSCSSLTVNGSSVSSPPAYVVEIAPGVFQLSKAMTLDSSGIGLMPLGTSNTNCLRFYGGTTNRETMNIYRVSDSNGLIIASRTTSSSNNKSYPLLNLISTDNPSTFVAGVSATTADLLKIDWNDKPTGGFTSQSHRLCFNIGNTQAYKLGYPHTFSLVSSADAICIAPSASTATPSSNGCLYLVSNSVNRMIWNTNTPYSSSSYGSAPITLNNGNIYIRSSNDLNGNSTAYDMPLLMVSSNSSPVEVSIQINNGSNATTSNSGYIGTTTSNDFVLMTANSRRLTVTAAGRIGIGTGTPVAPLQIASTISYTWNSGNNVGLSVYRLRTDNGVTETATGTAVTYTNVCAIINGYIDCEATVMQSDRRLKQEITDVPIERVECLYKSLKIQSYKWKAHPNKPKELGLIAHDVLDQGFLDLVARIPDSDPELTEGAHPWLEPAGVKLSVDYPKLTAYNMRMIQALIERVEELEKNP
jgi:hypothetical protein